MPPIVKNVYLLRTKSCAWFGLNFSIFLLCQVKIPDEKNTRHLYLLGKNINKPLVHFISHCRPEILERENLSTTLKYFVGESQADSG